MFAFVIGFNTGSNNTQISTQRIELAQTLCGERGLDSISMTIVKCKDGSIYQNYYKEST